jgi:hypothetical protein
LAVLIVSGFSALVDWRKEKEFVKRSQEDEDAKMVSKPTVYFIPKKPK